MIIAVLCPEDYEDENHFDYALSHFKADKIYTMSGYECKVSKKFTNAPRIEDLSEVTEDFPVYVFAPPAARNFTPDLELQDFKAPEDCILVFGPNNTHLRQDQMGDKTPTNVVNIPTDDDTTMYSYSAYLIAMWHIRNG